MLSAVFEAKPIAKALSNSEIPVIGLAGGIGSGKSMVARILRELGCVVSDSDAAARAALQEPTVRDQLVEWWGGDILDEQGEVNRSKVARIAFNNPAEKTRLEGLIHPIVERKRQATFAAAPEKAAGLVIDAPLLFEAGLDRVCDAVIYVDTPREVRLQRVRDHRGWDEAELNRREGTQLALDEKRRRADYIVRNDGGPGDLTEQVRRILATITASRRISSPDH